MKKTFFSESFGCRVNEAERQELNRQLLKKNYQFTDKNPYFYIINTCSVTHKAEREARNRLYQIKRKFPSSKIIITGCAATYWKKNNQDKKLGADLVVDNLNKEFLVKIIEKRFIKETDNNHSDIVSSNQTFGKFLDSGRVLIKIQDGCQRFCTFCIVPYLRGRPKSLKTADIIEKIKKYTGKVSEVILTAINTEAFGFDTGEKFTDLLKSTIDQTVVPRISLGSIHPWSINEEFFKFYQDYIGKKRLVDFFHIPIQSGSDKILQIMKRGYTKSEIVEKINLIKKINPYALVGTDIIVGFLEETDEDFQNTYDFLKKTPIDKFHVFRFSIRNNTASYFMAKRLNKVADSVKKQRAKALILLGKQKYEQFLKLHLEKVFSCLILNKKIDNFKEGLLSNQVPILIADDKLMPGEIKNIKITEFKKGKLFGKIV